MLLQLYKKYTIPFLLFCAICLCHFNAISQSQKNFKIDKISSENYKIEKGLSQNSVFCITQDYKGYMWFGTWDGLNKYDGYNFIVYQSDLFEQEGNLSSSNINTVFEDRYRNLWVGTSSGLNRYKRNSHTFDQYYHNPDSLTTISHDTIWCIFQDSRERLWIGTSNGLNLFDYTNSTFKCFCYNKEDITTLSNNTILNISEDNNGGLWIATKNGLNRFDVENNYFQRFYHIAGDKNSLAANKVYSVFRDSYSNIWIGTLNGLSKYNKGTNNFTTYKNNPLDNSSLSSNDIKVIFEDSKGILWIGTNGGGINIYNREDNTFSNITQNQNDKNSLSGNKVYSIFEDNTGIIWVGTELNGLNKINRNASRFSHSFNSSDDNNSINNNVIRSITEDKNGKLFIATNKGINIFDPKTKKYTYVLNEKHKNSISSNNTSKIFIDKAGNYWIGTIDKGLDYYNISSGNFKNYASIKDNKESLSDAQIWDIHEDKDGVIWVATHNGLNRFNKETNSFTIFKHSKSDNRSICNNIILDIYEDSKGRIWLSTLNGLSLLLNKEKGVFKNYVHNPLNRNSLSVNSICSVNEDNNGVLWISTLGGGLNKFNPEKNSFVHFTSKNGLTSNTVYASIPDEDDNLWISTNYGISKLDIDKETFVNYDVKDGLQSNEFNNGAYYKNEKGEIFFGGMNGYNSFNPIHINKNTNIPPVIITSFKILNRDQQFSFNNGDTIALSHSDNFFTFEFSAVDYNNPQKNSYAYKLDRYDKDWTYVDANRRYADYTDVNPGSYKFMVKASNNDGVWNEDGAVITVLVKPLWWETLLFRISIVSILIIFLALIIYIRFKSIQTKHYMERKMHNVEKSLYEIERKALRLQMNPHFIFNTLNSIQYFILNNDKLASNKYLTKFAKLMRITLDNSQYSNITISEEIKALTLYIELEALRFEDRFEYKINIDNKYEIQDYKIPSMIIQPFVENAIIHGLMNKSGVSRLDLDLRIEDKNIICTIEDNGVGREQAIEIKSKSKIKHKSLGSKITETRLNLINSLYGRDLKIKYTDLKDDKGNPEGTKVEIFIPVMG